MRLIEQYQPRREQIWPAVDQFFAGLPTPLFRQGVVLKNNLATFYSDTGQFKDILRREQDLPLLYLHFWLLADLGGPNLATRAALEKELFLAMLYTCAAVYTQHSILDESTNIDQSYLFLAQALTRQADVHLARLFAGDSPFWQQLQVYWTEYAAANITTADGQPPTAEKAAHQLAFTKIPVAAVAFGAAQETSLPELAKMMDRLNFVWQTRRDFWTLRRDLAQRRLSYPLYRTLLAADIDPLEPVAPERVLGALVLSGVVAEICDDCMANLAECRAIAAALRLANLLEYLGIVEGLVQKIRALFEIGQKRPGSSITPLQRPFCAPYAEPLPKVIQMAEGYLLADPTFRESWEVQRRGGFGRPEMTAKAFPAGLIVEIMARHGHNVSANVEWIFETLRKTNYRYYDFADMPPDADDLGLLLRLYPYAERQAGHRSNLEIPLGWLAENITESGEIPVWFTRQPDFDQNKTEFVALWGESCVTVESNLLLGLLAYDPVNYRDLIEQSARSILSRWLKRGLSATSHYTPLYSLWLGLALIGQLMADPWRHNLGDQLGRAALRLTGRLAEETKRHSISPQEAAFLTLACLSPGLPTTTRKLFDPGWLTILYKSQRYDGSWAAEPLYGTPTRGELAAWYSSRPVTTAFCYHALKIYVTAQSLI